MTLVCGRQRSYCEVSPGLSDWWSLQLRQKTPKDRWVSGACLVVNGKSNLDMSWRPWSLAVEGFVWARVPLQPPCSCFHCTRLKFDYFIESFRIPTSEIEGLDFAFAVLLGWGSRGGVAECRSVDLIREACCGSVVPLVTDLRWDSDTFILDLDLAALSQSNGFRIRRSY